MDKLFVGLDVSLKDYKVCLMDGEGERIGKSFALKNNGDGSQVLVDRVVEAAAKIKAEKVLIGYESTSVYGWHLQYFLADSPELAPFSPTIICFNPAVIDNHKKSLGDLPKNDHMDAFAIADRLRGRLPRSISADFRYLALQRLTRHRFHVVECIVREKNYYLNPPQRICGFAGDPEQPVPQVQRAVPSWRFLRQFRRGSHGSCG
ncbi:MAG: IS110 family transposase [Oscillospiraceae bacterium]|nr:IS110 family transposase [Oscillospiraceae bacterium]